MSREIQYFSFSEDTVGIFDRDINLYVPINRCSMITVDGNIFAKFKRPLQKRIYTDLSPEHDFYEEAYSIDTNKDIWINMSYRDIIQELKEVPEWTIVSYEEAKRRVEERKKIDFENKPSIFESIWSLFKGDG